MQRMCLTGINPYLTGQSVAQSLRGDNSEKRSIKRVEGAGKSHKMHNKLREDAVAVMRPNLAVDKSYTELYSLTTNDKVLGELLHCWAYFFPTINIIWKCRKPIHSLI